MKKILFSFVMLFFFVFLTGCSKENNWVNNKESSKVVFIDEVKLSFEEAINNYSNKNLKPVALLGKQIVSGTNYMFLSKSEENNKVKYSVVTVYKDLENNSTVKNFFDFDVSKYTNEDISLDQETMLGSWKVEIPSKPIMLDEKVQSYFNDATSKIVGVTYYPIHLLAKKENDGFNYAIICYGKMSDLNSTVGLFVLNIHVDNNDKSEIKNISAVNLNEYN